MRHTKAEIIEAYAICFRVAVSYMALSSRYDGLKSYIDILHKAHGPAIIQSYDPELWDEKGIGNPKMFYAMLDALKPHFQHVPTTGFYAESTDAHEAMMIFQSPCCEIIGNIYDNPELLEDT